MQRLNSRENHYEFGARAHTTGNSMMPDHACHAESSNYLSHAPFVFTMQVSIMPFKAPSTCHVPCIDDTIIFP
jgi:hypothetical protein